MRSSRTQIRSLTQSRIPILFPGKTTLLVPISKMKEKNTITPTEINFFLKLFQKSISGLVRDLNPGPLAP